MQIFISLIDRTSNFRSGTLEIEDVINERSTARLQLVDITGSLSIQDGEPIEVYDNDLNLIFSGYLLFPKKFVPIGNDAIFYDLECADQHQIADRWLVAKTYLNTSEQDIESELYHTYL